ncbi:hypothetical protein TSUD_356480 [Trifolium subterraneum]|uniref:CCHC-type domain-containing protein n=1 Tax=Trifolium subterraneum TaxID=3900 RepID=A0A2Z6MQE8_TRISU|nr:hypothetical protein TSUD_356480 [Trifolium subterraneum]
MSNINLEDLSFQEEEEGFTSDIEEEGENQVDFRWCLVGRFLTDRPIHVNSMKIAMAESWRPVKGVKIKEANSGLFLFQFSHELDMEGVLQGGPWTFDNHMLIVERVKLGVQIENIPLYHVDFWVQVHNLPTGLMAEKVGKTLANYIGSFVEYDKNNNSSFWRQYMRIRVRVDVRQPLKKESKVKSRVGEWCTINFKYEKLGVFCFVCGTMGHTEKKCEVRFDMERDDGVRGWSKELRAEPRSRNSRSTSRWLKEEGGGIGSSSRGNSSAAGINAGGQATDPTSSNSNGQSMQPNNAPHTIITVHSSSVNSPDLVTVPHTNINTEIQPQQSTTQSISLNYSYQPIQPLHTNLMADNPIITQSLANQDPIIPSITVSPIIHEAINQPPNFPIHSSSSWQPGLPGTMIVLSWNFRGLSVPSAIPNLRNIAQGHKPGILFLSETLSKKNRMESIRIMLKFDSCLSIDVEGRSGGLAIMWKDNVKCRVMNYSRNFINIIVEDSDIGDWRLTCYYGYPERSRRKMAWDLLRELRHMSNLPWCVIGDFNDLLSQEDKKGLLPHPNWLCSGFRSAVNDCDLTDIHLEGYPFTWLKSGATDHAIEERLDRALVSSDWISKFPNAKLINLLSSHSDHSSILLQCNPKIKQYHRKEFRFENSWLKEEDIEEVVNVGWNHGEDLEIIHRLTHCADELQRWGRKKRRRFKEEIKEHEEEMERTRDKGDASNTSRFLEAQKQHAKVLIQEDIFWRQRAKMHWLKDGDLNTKFFHMSASARAKVKKIEKLITDENEVVIDQQELGDVARKYFQELFKPKGGSHEPVLSLILTRISAKDNAMLEAPITKEELRTTLFQMHPDKSPGPDGYNPAFFQKNWHLCGDEVFMAAKDWLQRGYFPSSLNETNICLIPKCDRPLSMKEFRPISLCNVLYKVVSKLLANRLKQVIDKCIYEEQSAFVDGRSITDNAFIAIEIIHALKRKSRGAKGEMALKIDISKAYDKVEWGFLNGVLIRMGFSETSNLSETRKIMEILKTYEDASGQEINLSKSEIFFSRNISLSAQNDLAELMGVTHVMGTGTNLGVPSMVGRSKKATFAYIKDRIWRKINSWRSRPLSKAGKEVMIKSVLQAIPSYPMDVMGKISLCKGGRRFGFSRLQSFQYGYGGETRMENHDKAGDIGGKDIQSKSVGDGSKIMVMKDPWLRGQGRGWVSAPQSQGVYNLSVKNLMVEGLKQWDYNIITNLFSHEAAEEILVVPLIREVQEDRIVWQEEQNGEYTVKSGYRILMKAKDEERCRRVEGSWKCLWQIRAPPKVKHLLWRICRDCLPTRVQLRRHYVKESKDVAGRVATVVWMQWYNRNQWIWNQKKRDGTQVSVQAFHMWDDWYKAQKLNHNIPDNDQQQQLHRWSPPRHGWFKCNVDAGFHNGGRITSGGWCIRDDNGQFIRAGTHWMRRFNNS